MPADKTPRDTLREEPANSAEDGYPKRSPSSSETLLGDLQNIRTLLDEADPSTSGKRSDNAFDNDPTDTPEAAAGDADAVPLLDDPLPTPQADSPISPEVFERLLGDDWKDQADTVLQAARHRIDASAASWSPEDTDALNDALRVRIDETIQDWLQQMLTERIGELRTRVLTAMADEINLRVNEPLENIEPTNLLDAIRRAPRKDTDGS